MTVLNALRPRPMHMLTLIMIALGFAAGFGAGSHNRVSQAQDNVPSEISTEGQALLLPVWQVYDTIQRGYLDPEGDDIPSQALIDGAIRGMVEVLGDPSTRYLDAAGLDALSMRVAGESVGLGVVVSTVAETGDIQIVSIVPGSPAETAGILPGDSFVSIDGEPVAGMSQQQLVERAGGDEGTTVELVMRRGSEELPFTLTRSRIVKPNVDVQLLENNIGYIRIAQFSPRARAELDDALTSLNAPTLDGLILDLRDNAGGTLGPTVDVASAFIESGVVLTEQFAGDRERVFEARGTFAGLEVPMVVLVDERTQSAAEVLAGALRDYDRATLIGETTFGKGTVQTLVNLVNGGGLRLTIARVVTPEGTVFHGAGLTPDVEVDWDPAEGESRADDPQLAAAVEYLAGD